ncbi:MAG: protein kinase [Bryobacteraceae bacterium]|nr:protein kinase [Bryobacteraceae bacterium]
MRIQPGAKLGHYEFEAVIGVGGMGEVYRARDTRLGRYVAVKLLAGHLVQDVSFRTRLRQEAAAAARLNHPNVVAVYDAGEDYIVSEFVEGVTLRKLEKPTIRQTLEIVAQVASGLAAAHAMGVVHRDIKPENIMITAQGAVKILDFGLAKPVADSVGTAKPGLALTGPGMVMGTVSYMSPEQVRGAQVDHRSDIFSLGLVLHEMLTGKKVFERESAAEIMSAILKEDPPPLPSALPAALAFIVSRCLEKNPESRFQSAHDLGVSLQALATVSQPAAALPNPSSPRRRKGPFRWVLAAALVFIALAAGWIAGRLLSRSGNVTFRQVTFQRGFVSSARFSPGSSVIVYSAAWNGDAGDLFLSARGSPEARSIGLRNVHLFSISANNEVAVALNCRYVGDNSQVGILGVAPLYGGAPRIVMPDVSEADWDPSGKQLALVRSVRGVHRLEYPAGKVLYQTAGWLGDLRFSPRGDQIAFSDHPTRDDDRGRIVTVDLHGNAQHLSGEWESIEGLVWTKDASEVWYSASDSGYADTLYASAPGRSPRFVFQFPVSVKLLDLGSDGVLLFTTFDDDRHETWASLPGASADQSLDWLGSSFPGDLSQDGKLLLFSQYGQAGGRSYGLYLRNLGEPAPVRLGEGDAMSLSPDGRYALALQYTEPQRLALFDFQSPEPQLMLPAGLNYQTAAQWFPDSRRIIFEANEAGRPSRIWMQDVPAGKPQPITPEGVSLEGSGLSPDGTKVAARAPEGVLRLYSIGGGGAAEIRGPLPDDRLVRWSPSGQELIVMSPVEGMAQLNQIDLATGKRTPGKRIANLDPVGVTQVTQVRLSADGQTIVYGQNRRVRTLRTASGLK